MSVSPMTPAPAPSADRPDCRLSTALDRALVALDRALAAHPTRDVKMVAADLARFAEYYPQHAEMYTCLLAYILGSARPSAFGEYRYLRVEDTHMRDIVDKLLAYDRVTNVVYDGYYCIRSPEHYSPDYLSRLPGVVAL